MLMISYSLCKVFRLFQLLTNPRAFHNNSATLIDNILTNKVDVKITSGNIISDISDHYSQFCVLHTSLENSKSRGKRIRDFSGFSEDAFNSELYNVLCNQINHGDSFDVDKAFSHFYDSLNVLVNKHAPLKAVSNRTRKQFSKAWISSGLKKSIKVKNFLLQSGNLVKYKLYRNRTCTLTRLSKKNYFHAFFSDNLNNMKNTWNGINNLINNKRKKSKVVSSLKHLNDNSTTKDPLEISNIFNWYFTSVGHNLATQVPSSSYRFTEYLSPNNNPSSFFFDSVSPDDIERKILYIPKNKAYGLYSCPIRTLSCAKHIVSGPLADIFNMYVQISVLPSKLKEAKVIPVYKSDDETEPGNYRPISLLSIFNRIFEKLMYHHLKSFLDKNNILFKSQYGFREKHSTQHAILDTVNIIQNNMDIKLFTCGIFIDLKKAFDTVDHAILLQKLNHYGIRGIINDWFSSYLLGRSQVTEVDSYLSSNSQITCGVPQGSVKAHCYSWSTSMIFITLPINYHSTSLLMTLTCCVQTKIWNLLRKLSTTNCLKPVSEWLNANKLTLNAKKSNYVIFRPYQRKLGYSVNIQMFDNSTHTVTSLECKEHVKYLGILQDSNLSWKFHIEYVALKISRIIGVIARLRHFVPLCTLLIKHLLFSDISLHVLWFSCLGSSC